MFQRRNHDSCDDTTGKPVRKQSGQPGGNRGGRPPKFSEPRRPVTVTLPERTLTLLDAVDQDRARAIVRVTDAALSGGAPGGHLVEVVEVLPGLGIILVGPSRILQKIPWLRLVELAPTRYLLSIPSGTSVDSLEVALHDLLEVSTPDDVRERAMLEKLGALVRRLRRRGSVSKAEMLFVDMAHVREEWSAPASGESGSRAAKMGGSGQSRVKPSARRPRVPSARSTAPPAEPDHGSVVSPGART